MPLKPTTEGTDEPCNQSTHPSDNWRDRCQGRTWSPTCCLPNNQVAKIFDPRYSPHDNSEYRSVEEFNYNVDLYYTREVAAYNELDAQFGGNEIPSFFGCWTFDMATPSPLGVKMRQVRLILMEYLQGTSLLELLQTSFLRKIAPTLLQGRGRCRLQYSTKAFLIGIFLRAT
jgi:hypothetical protein